MSLTSAHIMIMQWETAAARISKASTGVYLAYPTTSVLRPTYRGHKTLVNAEHTKVGIARSSFASRERQYLATFQHEVAFFPLLNLPAQELTEFEARLLHQVRLLYPRSGRAREWFRTTERQALAELVWSMS